MIFRVREGVTQQPWELRFPHCSGFPPEAVRTPEFHTGPQNFILAASTLLLRILARRPTRSLWCLWGPGRAQTSHSYPEELGLKSLQSHWSCLGIRSFNSISQYKHGSSTEERFAIPTRGFQLQGEFPAAFPSGH